jgi:hypothetical protein
MRWTRVAGLVLFLASCARAPDELPTRAPRIVVAGTPSPAPATEPPARPASAATVSALPAAVVRPGASPSPVALPLSVLVGRNGSDVRVGLDLALEENVYLAAAAIEAAAHERDDELAGTARTLDQTAATLAAIVGAVRGPEAQQALLEALRRQTAEVLDYTRGTGARPSAPPDALLQQRAQGLLDIVDSAIGADSADAVHATTTLRAAAARMDDVVRPLAADLAAQVPAQVAGATDAVEVELRLALDRRLQERVFLVGRALSASVDGRDVDRQAAAQTADATAEELGQLFAPFYGDSVATHLAGALRERNAALLGPTSSGNRDSSANALELARDELDSTFSGANALLPRGMLVVQLRAEDQELLATVDALGARDWGSAYGHLHQAARLSQRFGDALAQATADRFPGRFLPTPAPGAP